MKRAIDHIVYCVPDLEEGIEKIRNLFGVQPIWGGRHLNRGTKNALLNLGNSCYLEILAADEDNVDFRGNRWMGIDLIDAPRITRWSLKSENLIEDSRVLSDYAAELGAIDGGKRQTSNGQVLKWQMILPIASPSVDVLPFMTDWSQSESHPTDSLVEGCTLQKIELFHPQADLLHGTLIQLGTNVKITKDTSVRIVIHVHTPNGLVTLE